MGQSRELMLYKHMYLYLFRQVSAALAEMEWGEASHAPGRLKQAQRRCEEIFIEEETKA